MDFGAAGQGEDAGGVFGGDAAAGEDDDTAAGTAVQHAECVCALFRRRRLAGGQDAVAAQADDLLQGFERLAAAIECAVERDAYAAGRIREEMAVVGRVAEVLTVQFRGQI